MTPYEQEALALGIKIGLAFAVAYWGTFRLVGIFLEPLFSLRFRRWAYATAERRRRVRNSRKRNAV